MTQARIWTREVSTQLGGTIPSNRRSKKRSLPAGVPERKGNTQHLERYPLKNVLQLIITIHTSIKWAFLKSNLGRKADRPSGAPDGIQTKPVRSKGELPRKPRSNNTDPSDQTEPSMGTGDTHCQNERPYGASS